MTFKNFTSYKRLRGPSPIQKLIRSTVSQAMRLIDEVIAGKTLPVFENMIIDILSTGRVYEYDTHASYYGKLLHLIDLQDDIALVSNTGAFYRVKDYPDIMFSKKELEAIWKRYTTLKQRELSKKFIEV